jgi:anti-sigma regulatory factor (Ser/Thr protein kinase)
MCWSLNANDAGAARAVRKAATATLRSQTESEECLGAAELVIGELLSNAARHADGNVCVELTIADGHAAVSVHDTSSTFELDIRRPADEFSESGRGLFIISELARKIAVVPLSGFGKRVTVTLDLPVSTEPDSPACSREWLRHDAGICLAPRVARYASKGSERPST